MRWLIDQLLPVAQHPVNERWRPDDLDADKRRRWPTPTALTGHSQNSQDSQDSSKGGSRAELSTLESTDLPSNLAIIPGASPALVPISLRAFYVV